MRSALLGLAMLAGVFLCLTAMQSAGPERFVIYYADTAPAEQFAPYKLLVLDSTHHPRLAPLKHANKTILGYISLGEVDKNSVAYGQLKAKGLILQENKNWKNSYFVDMRDPLWQKLVVEEIVPGILAQGFDGLFLDTLDNPVALEENNPRKYSGMREAAVRLVKALREKFPNIKIMMNRGYGILPDVAPSIDAELGESIYTDFDFTKKAYDKVKKEEYEEQVKVLQDAKRDNRNLTIYTLDYAKPDDAALITDIYRTERANGFIPYVATVELDQIVNEPGM